MENIIIKVCYVRKILNEHIDNIADLGKKFILKRTYLHMLFSIDLALSLINL